MTAALEEKQRNVLVAFEDEVPTATKAKRNKIFAARISKLGEP